MGHIKVKNIMTRYQARLYRKQLRRHLQGMFLKVGNRKIPPGKTTTVETCFSDQVDYLEDLGVLQVLDVQDDGKPKTRVRVFNRPKEPVIKDVEDDFVIITSSSEPIFNDEPETEEPEVQEKNTPEPVKESEVPEEQVVKETAPVEEPVEPVQEEAGLKDTQDVRKARILEVMVEMVTDGRDLTKTGMPELAVLRDKLGDIDISSGERTKLYKEYIEGKEDGQS